MLCVVCVLCVLCVWCVCVVCCCVSVRRAKSGETVVEASRDTNAQIVRYAFFLGAKDKSDHLTVGSLQRFPRRAGVEQLRQVKPMIRGIGNMLFSICSHT